MDAEELIDYYMSEACAELALCLHRASGLPLAILWDNEALEDWDSGPEPTLAHVFVIDPATGEAVDVKGRRGLQAVKEDFFDLLDPEVDDRVSEAELLALMGDRRPLYATSAEERQRAVQAVRALGLLAHCRAAAS